MKIRVTKHVPETYTSERTLPPGEYDARHSEPFQPIEDWNRKPAHGWRVYHKHAMWTVMDSDWDRAIKDGSIIEIKEGDVSNLPAVTTSEVVAYMTPEDKIKEASRQAKLLKSVVDQGRLARKFGGEKEHLAFEAWQTLAEWNGLAPITDWCNPIVEDGKIMGFEARVNVLDVNTGKVVGSAINRCTRHEPNWKNKPDYALESMAQTRCGGKALRSRLSHIVVLAGYSTTPAEEMDGVDVREESPKSSPVPDDAATDKQKKALFAKANEKFGSREKALEFIKHQQDDAPYWTKKAISELLDDFDAQADIFLKTPKAA